MDVQPTQELEAQPLIDRVYEAYLHLHDDPFVAEFLRTQLMASTVAC